MLNTNKTKNKYFILGDMHNYKIKEVLNLSTAKQKFFNI